MNKIITALLIIIIIVVIYLAVSMFKLDYLIRDPVSLNIGGGTTGSGNVITGATMGSVVSTAIDAPSSTRYNYSGWFFIHSNFTTAGKDNVLFNRGQDFLVALNGSTLKIYAGTGAVPAVATASAIGTVTSDKTPVISIPNFPFQKWVYLVINVDGTTVDVYVDGKFFASASSAQLIGSTAATPITYGNQYTIGNLCRFSRPATTINPQKVWQQYMQGSGQGGSFSSTGVKVELLKNGQPKLDKKIM
jgi:hypothetical protein